MPDPDPRQAAYAARRRAWTDQIGLDIQARHAAAAKLLAAQGIDVTDTAAVARARDTIQPIEPTNPLVQEPMPPPHCLRCDGQGWIYVPASGYISVDPCPACNITPRPCGGAFHPWR